MTRWKSLGIAASLKLMAALVTVALMGSAWVANQTLNDISNLSHRTGHNRLPQLAEMAEIELNVTRASLQLRHAILARNAEERDAALQDIARKQQAIAQLLDEYEGRLFTPEGRRRFDPIRPAIANFWDKGTRNVALIREGAKDEAFAYLVEHTIPARNALLQQLSDTVSYQREKTGQDIANIESDVRSIKAVLVALFAVVTLGILSAAFWLSRTLKRRIEQSKKVAECVSAGDLSQTIEPRGADEFTPLLDSLAEMQRSLIDVVTKVRDQAHAVASASEQIGKGSAELSDRTVRQTHSLHQTASTMSQLGSTVAHNALHAAQATAMANEASAVAQQGGEAVKAVVDTMQGIHDASRQISDIINVIDGIAFQTNILALNAAVEAARAGEQGRGFAVVAGEVRSLAQRSAEAAREIKTLITASSEQVERGTQLVDHAGQTMTQIVASIERVNAIVDDISRASQEQTHGVQQVDQAVRQMDEATQQNATLVEQSTAAASGLQSQSEALVQSVAVFRL